jgi:hypothetical protein
MGGLMESTGEYLDECDGLMDGMEGWMDGRDV